MTSLGYRFTDEQRARCSAAEMGHKGCIFSLESLAKMSASHIGHIHSAETKRKMSESHMGHETSPETRAKISAANLGRKLSLEVRAQMSVARWQGGLKVNQAKQRAKRRAFGFVPLNEWFEGCEAHHVDAQQVIYLPYKLHHSIYHRQTDGLGMAKINAIAYNFLFEQEVESAMSELLFADAA